MSGAPIVIRSLSKRFGSVEVLQSVDLSIDAGAFAAVLGQSGSGKTTLLRIIAGFERPDTGSVLVGDRTLSSPSVHVPPEDRRIGIVPQDGALFPHLNVAQNIGFGLPGGERRSTSGRERIGELLELVGLEGLGRRMPSELSGGQQQRVAVARCLAPRPDVVLLDEPFSALDTTLRAAVRRDVASVLRRSGTTTVLVTHDQEEALAMASLVAVLEHGHIAQAAGSATLYQFPVSESVARFLGDAIILDADASGNSAQSVFGTLPIRRLPNGGSPITGRCRMLLRPEQLALSHTEQGEGAPGRVTEVEFHGHDALATVELDDGLVVWSRMRDPLSAHVGDHVRVRATGDVVVFGDSEPFEQ